MYSTYIQTDVIKLPIIGQILNLIKKVVAYQCCCHACHVKLLHLGRTTQCSFFCFFQHDYNLKRLLILHVLTKLILLELWNIQLSVFAHYIFTFLTFRCV